MNITFRMEPDVHKHLKRVAVERRTTITALINDAIRQRLDPKIQESADRVLLRTARLMRLRMDRLELASRANAEALAMMARTLFAALPPAAPEQQAQAAKTFERFADALAAKLTAKKTLLDPLLDALETSDDQTAPHYDNEQLP